MTNPIHQEEFNLRPIRGIYRSDQPWIVAPDAATILNFDRPMEAIEALCPESLLCTVPQLGGPGIPLTIINLKDLARLASHSYLPNKAGFLSWIQGFAHRVSLHGSQPRAWVLEETPSAPGAATPDPGALVTLASGGEPRTSSLAIAQGTENDHASVIKLVRTYRADLEEFGLVGFEIQPRPSGQHGGGDVEFALLNEQQATLLMTYMRNSEIVRKFKMRLVKAFYELRNHAQAMRMPQTLPEALRAYAETLEKKEALEVKARDQAATIQTMGPKAAFHDAVSISASSAISISEVAQLLGYGSIRFFALLKDKGILLSHGSRENLPYQEFIDRGYFEVREGIRENSPSGEPKTYRHARVTGKGQAWLQAKFGKAK
ncbi:phage antirepressor KilAC domain-containing protein [Geothrix sp. 21YS21S-2]|uniref:phage antirepressor KilAC domain-containing protein n=1 Tax=Geothrix sp. 21YS21S-2 TaxID=3068893 RepID=UPI0027B8CCFE|nr:phage antirepressor KilAC domain-containing protein [Geothrix sp. 21YS21S-2]